ncbi:MAG: hypothetical protein IT303_08005 [Dehalococcoidia bacterium]|nr:hypothetical protein [Dehalococcoidia bacterium]
MVNPVLTILFDIFLIGSGATILGGMILEYRASRRGAVGGVAVPFRRRQPAQLSPRTRARAGSVGRARRRLAA